MKKENFTPSAFHVPASAYIFLLRIYYVTLCIYFCSLCIISFPRLNASSLRTGIFVCRVSAPQTIVGAPVEVLTGWMDECFSHHSFLPGL